MLATDHRGMLNSGLGIQNVMLRLLTFPILWCLYIVVSHPATYKYWIAQHPRFLTLSVLMLIRLPGFRRTTGHNWCTAIAKVPEFLGLPSFTAVSWQHLAGVDGGDLQAMGDVSRELWAVETGCWFQLGFLLRCPYWWSQAESRHYESHLKQDLK